jgi:antitoxin ParD1/3/4
MSVLDILWHARHLAGMNVSLTPELEKLVQDKISSGLYTSASEVVREALRLLAESDRQRAMRVHQLREEIAKGLAEAKAGKLLDGPTVVARIRADLRKRAKKRQGR